MTHEMNPNKLDADWGQGNVGWDAQERRFKYQLQPHDTLKKQTLKKLPILFSCSSIYTFICVN